MKWCCLNYILIPETIKLVYFNGTFKSLHKALEMKFN
jgi:hypothetical protein